jgi:DNA-binding NarL/FixJ family response regulator
MTDAEPIVVCLVEDDRRFRDALQLLVDAAPGLRCAGAWGSVEEAVAARVRAAPQVILLDIHLPGASGVDGLPRIRERFPGTSVLMLTVLEDEGRIFEALCRGADGYLLKSTPPARLLEQIAEAASGGAPMSPEIARKVIRLLRRPGRARSERSAQSAQSAQSAAGAEHAASRSDGAPVPGGDAALTPQETRFLALLADGFSYQGAARELEVSINTVRNYVRSIYDKLHVHSRSEAVSKAIRAGLI